MIRKELVSCADTFPDVFNDFEAWLNDNTVKENKSFILVTDGPTDVKYYLKRQCALSDVPFPSWACEWIDLKLAFKRIFNLHYQPRLPVMLEHLMIDFYGQWHRGKDDVQNIANVLCQLILDGYEITPNSDTSI
ncbi:3'-5' exoribonuclease 1 [Trichoplax sp. H2]|nr:3'-5' exoribonuclease 1 [Trichoplax sp. H2]|eukprot:RDD37738.1 3'-5' exoribonuclease 1 [Trichoplax sp. H2]